MNARLAMLLSKPTKPPVELMSLFSNGERGCMFLPQFTKYAWQDAAKTIPAVVGMPVAKMVCPATGVEATFTDVTLLQNAGGQKYLSANATSSKGATAAIDLTGTDTITVIAGVYKASDAALGFLAETSANADLNAGAFYIAAPLTGGEGGYGVSVGGSAVNAKRFTTYTAPINNVLALTFKTAAADFNAAISAQINGASAAGVQVSNAASTGNFGNHALNLFCRNGASFFLNGGCYGFVLRGASSSAGQIADASLAMARLSGVNF